MSFIRTSSCMLIVALASAAVMAQTRPKPYSAPESFSSDVQGGQGNSAVISKIRVQIDKYTHEQDRKAILDALTTGGYTKFLQTLRATPVIGYVEIEKQKFNLRFARET